MTDTRTQRIVAAMLQNRYDKRSGKSDPHQYAARQAQLWKWAEKEGLGDAIIERLRPVRGRLVGGIDNPEGEARA